MTVRYPNQRDYQSRLQDQDIENKLKNQSLSPARMLPGTYADATLFVRRAGWDAAGRLRIDICQSGDGNAKLNKRAMVAIAIV
jgi:hypothetical protein